MECLRVDIMKREIDNNKQQRTHTHAQLKPTLEWNADKTSERKKIRTQHSVSYACDVANLCVPVQRLNVWCEWVYGAHFSLCLHTHNCFFFFFGACLYRIICIGAGLASSTAAIIVVAAAAVIADLSVFMVLFLSFRQNYRFAFIHFVSYLRFIQRSI